MDKHSPSGLLLKKAREAKGLTIEMVHESTKVPMDAIRAIEEGYTIRTLSPFYIRGFLKIYAQYLKININDVVEDYHPEKLPAPIIEKKPSEPPPKLKTFEGFNFIQTSEIKDWIIRILAAILIALLLFKVINFLIHLKGEHAGKASKASISVAEKKKTVKPKALLPAEKAKAAVVPLVPKAPLKAPSSETASRRIDLAIRAKKDNWLQVKVDGEIVFRSNLKKGSVETWHAKDNIELSGKDIGELEFELNGKILAPLSRENRTAKKVVITQNGFSVRQ